LTEASRAPFRVAALQTVSGPDVAANLVAAGALAEEAAAAGAKLVALPEYFGIMGMRDTDKLAARERPGAGPIQDFLANTARRLGLWVVGGSVPLDAGRDDRVYNSSLVYDPQGRLAARYDKIHLFGLELGTERFSEARTILPGGTISTVDTPFGRLGLSVCYDLRFPELYRAMGPVDLILVPSAFTATTGDAHWEVLLRARAIENQACVLAPAQGGVHPSGRRTHGHSMVVDAWGRILAERASDGPGVVLADIDPSAIADVRRSLPALEHRTLRGVSSC
jgi:predicted amidohydrolase